MRNSSPRSSSDAASASAWRALTSAASCLVRASSSCFSSPCACATCLPRDFCSARRLSNSLSAARWRASASRAASTSAGSSPRVTWLARTMSGLSRRRRRSITPAA
ncbi:Uncharacterised protein [Mycobacteroides abscessus]|nr:Uncharacterised protein [Mycobacteroides abscessus]